MTPWSSTAPAPRRRSRRAPRSAPNRSPGRPARTGARRLQDVVATLPGWATEDNGLLHSRGVDDGFLYVVDGVPVYERLDQTSGLAPDTSTIDALTVVTGYVPPEYGYKAGGVIDVRTRAATGRWRGFAETAAAAATPRPTAARSAGGAHRARRDAVAAGERPAVDRASSIRFIPTTSTTTAAA